MAWTFCFPVHNDPTKITLQGICVNIPELIWPLYLGPPLPDPPFITLPDFDQEEIRHLQILATIDSVAEELPDELSRDMQRSVAAHRQSLGQNLDAGIELSRHTQTAKCD